MVWGKNFDFFYKSVSFEILSSRKRMDSGGSAANPRRIHGKSAADPRLDKNQRLTVNSIII